MTRRLAHAARHLERKAEQRMLVAWQHAAELRRAIEPADY
jgi:hypothetical protein